MSTFTSLIEIVIASQKTANPQSSVIKEKISKLDTLSEETAKLKAQIVEYGAKTQSLTTPSGIVYNPEQQKVITRNKERLSEAEGYVKSVNVEELAYKTKTTEQMEKTEKSKKNQFEYMHMIACALQMPVRLSKNDMVLLESDLEERFGCKATQLAQYYNYNASTLLYTRKPFGSITPTLVPDAYLLKPLSIKTDWSGLELEKWGVLCRSN